MCIYKVCVNIYTYMFIHIQKEGKKADKQWISSMQNNFVFFPPKYIWCSLEKSVMAGSGQVLVHPCAEAKDASELPMVHSPQNKVICPHTSLGIAPVHTHSHMNRKSRCVCGIFPLDFSTLPSATMLTERMVCKSRSLRYNCIHPSVVTHQVSQETDLFQWAALSGPTHPCHGTRKSHGSEPELGSSSESVNWPCACGPDIQHISASTSASSFVTLSFLQPS